ncbi:glycosyltransferase [uncultured Porphyromonas sp.]|uniref:glycosyltransferase n=1 Tax=uncultured Porphyromonas sp. TaxID=159274 RepID=UPI00263498ED|nr:glycosyltransferase [uncultured Porphyromonas sp.]
MPSPNPQRPLKVLLLCTAEQGGGAAEACRRLLEGLSSIGLEARLLVLHGGEGDAAAVRSVLDGSGARIWAKVAFVLERAEIYLRNGRDRGRLFRVSTARWGFDVSRHPWVQWADVLHLHWINQGFLSLRGLQRLSLLGKPVFATLHDLWMATGICHLPLELSASGAELCPRYREGCGYCPLLSSRSEHDLSRQIWQRKVFLSSPAFHYIAVSTAEAALFGESPLMRSARPALVLPNPIDLELFSPQTAEAMPVPSWHEAGRYYLTLVAARLDDVVKGPELLKAIARAFRAQSPEFAARTTLVLVGETKRQGYFDDLALSHISLGRVSDRRELAAIYAHSDAVLSTSVYETFGQTLSEALAVGTPVLSFRCGGPEDIIEDGRTGYLIEAFDPKQYAARLIELLERRGQGRFDREACRSSVQRFSADRIASELARLYAAALQPTP